MAVSVAAATFTASWTTTPDPATTNVTIFGTQREGAVVFIVQSGAATDQITSVTLGGATLDRVATNGFAVDSAGETGAVYAYFLGSGVPVGNPLTLSIDHTAAAQTKRAFVFALDAAANTEVAASGKLEGDQANPQVALDSGAAEALRLCAVFSGLANTSDLAVLGSMTNAGVNIDFGQQVGRADYETTPSSGSTTIGYTSASDDVAMVAVAVAEVSAPAAAEIPILVMPQMRAR